MVCFFLAMGKSANFFFFLFPFPGSKTAARFLPGGSDCRKTYIIMKKDRLPYPYESAKSRDLCVAFCTYQGTSVAD